MASSEKPGLDELAHLLRRLEKIEGGPSKEARPLARGETPSDEPASAAKDRQPEGLIERIEASQSEPVLEQSETQPPSQHSAVASVSPQTKFEPSATRPPSKNSESTVGNSSALEEALVALEAKATPTATLEPTSSRRTASGVLIVFSIGLATLVSMAATLLLLAGNVHVFPKGESLTLPLWDALTGAATNGSIPPGSEAEEQARASTTAIEAAAPPTSAQSASQETATSPGLVSAAPPGKHVGGMLTFAGQLSMAAPSLRPPAKTQLMVAPKWVVPPGATIRLPIVLAARENTGREILISGLEPGASIRGAVEIVAGTWLLEADKLGEAELNRGATAPARLPLSIEIRSDTGVSMEQHSVSLLTSMSAAY